MTTKGHKHHLGPIPDTSVNPSFDRHIDYSRVDEIYEHRVNWLICGMIFGIWMLVMVLAVSIAKSWFIMNIIIVIIVGVSTIVTIYIAKVIRPKFAKRSIETQNDVDIDQPTDDQPTDDQLTNDESNEAND